MEQDELLRRVVDTLEVWKLILGSGGGEKAGRQR